MAFITGTQTAHAEFKQFSVSAGWLHAMPQGKANPFNINTAVANGTTTKVGTISTSVFMKSHYFKLNRWFDVSDFKLKSFGGKGCGGGDDVLSTENDIFLTAFVKFKTL